MENKVALYIHYPFCVKKCNYCDFLSAPADDDTRIRYLKALEREIKSYRMPVKSDQGAILPCKDDNCDCSTGIRLPEKFSVDTIYIGGGTPSIMTPGQLAELMDALRNSFDVDPDAEISIECNPGTADLEKLTDFRSTGVNRISIGVQSMNDDELRILGRIHSSSDAIRIIRNAREAGFDNINCDLMSAVPRQTCESWRDTLNKVADFGIEHISAYSLIIEEGTPFYDNCPSLPDEDSEREIYYMTKEILASSGYERYEISNYAKPGMECRHNIGYWTGHDYLGLGIGAASLINGRRFTDIRDIRKYISFFENYNYETGIHGIHENIEKLSINDRMEEFMFLGLRMTKGVSTSDFRARFGKTIEEVYGTVIKRQLELGLITDRNDRIALTDYGTDVSNSVMAEYMF